MSYIDLHTHTTASDGTISPEELIEYAIKKNLAAIAITDHDTIDGIEPARNHLGDSNAIEIISGIEFSTSSLYLKNDIHILGLYIDEKNSDFIHSLKSIVDSRNIRNEKMLEKLKELGIKLSIEDVIKTSSGGIITRAHFSKAMVEKGYVINNNEAFTKYIGNGCPAFVPRYKLPPDKAIKTIRNAGGVAVLAHPTLYHLNLRELDALIAELCEYGLQGIEGLYSLYNRSEISYLADFAAQYNLVIAGGSDFHGANKSNIDLGTGRGTLKIPYELLEPIKALAIQNKK